MAEEARPEIVKEPSPLPVTKEAVERALKEIAQDPGKAMMEESNIIQLQNPEINLTLHNKLQSLPGEQRAYIEGALWTHRILRTQAELNGVNLPRIAPNVGEVYLRDCIDEIRSTGVSQTVDDYNRKLGERVIAEEPELGNAIQEITKYRPAKESIYGGVADVYFLIKRTLEAKELGKKFGM